MNEEEEEEKKKKEVEKNKLSKFSF